MPDSVKEYKASVWNDKMSKMKNLVKQLHLGIIKILCNKCGAEMKPEIHYDFDDNPHKKQYVCTNRECGYSDYIVV